jgi:hypothetical protein
MTNIRKHREIEKAELRRELKVGNLVFQPGSKVDVIRITPETYKVFASNGWWAVSAEYFLEEWQSEADVDDLTPGDTLRALGKV